MRMPACFFRISSSSSNSCRFVRRTSQGSPCARTDISSAVAAARWPPPASKKQNSIGSIPAVLQAICRGLLRDQEARLPVAGRNEAHSGVYDLSERQHTQLLRRRDDLVSLLMYLTERR